MNPRLYVGNLSFTTTEDDLRSLFGQYGTVNDVAIIKDRETQRSKGFAFVTMASEEEADRATKATHGLSFDNRILKVNPARPREEGDGRGSFQPRQGGGGFHANHSNSRGSFRGGRNDRNNRGGQSQY